MRSWVGLGPDASLLGPRWLFLRAVGAVLVVVFAGIWREAPALCGPGGLAPVGGFLAQVRAASPHLPSAWLEAPSLFWLGAGAVAQRLVTALGLLGGVALLLNLWPRAALAVSWVALLSFVTTWQVFSATQVDQLMLEVMLLSLPFAPRGFRPGLGVASPARPVAVFLLRWMLFRVMLENGLIKLLAGDARWFDLSALDFLYETAPFPTFLGFLDHQLPHAWHAGEAGLTFCAELAAPLLALLAGRRGRWLAFLAWTLLQVGIQLTCNFGWLNTASFALGLLLLDDVMLLQAAGWLRWRRVSEAWDRVLAARPAELPSGTPWRIHGLRLAAGVHVILTLLAFARVVATAREAELPAPSAPERRLAAFRSANAYTLFGALLPFRYTVEFEGSNDGGVTWRPYRYRFQPQREDELTGFIAPWYARFEATLQVLSQSPEPSPLFPVVAGHLLIRTPAVRALFREDPFADRPATLLRIRGYRYAFTTWEEYRRTGRFWTRHYLRDHRPLSHLGADGQVREAGSAEEELQVMAAHGNRLAQVQWAARLASGEGVRKDVAAAAQWYRRAAEQGLPEAQAKYGYLLAVGEGVTRDLTQAADWFGRAAAQGEAMGQFFLGLCHAKGDGVERRPLEAARLYRLAGLQGYVPAQINLGFLHARGDGLPRNDVEALGWFGLAARSGAPEARRAWEALAARCEPGVRTAGERRTEQLVAELAAAR